MTIKLEGQSASYVKYIVIKDKAFVNQLKRDVIGPAPYLPDVKMETKKEWWNWFGSGTRGNVNPHATMMWGEKYLFSWGGKWAKSYYKNVEPETYRLYSGAFVKQWLGAEADSKPWVTNRKYKKMGNISPLYLTGKQTLRMAEREREKRQSDSVRLRVKAIHKAERSEYLNVIAPEGKDLLSGVVKATEKADLLTQYYLERLKPAIEIIEGFNRGTELDSRDQILMHPYAYNHFSGRVAMTRLKQSLDLLLEEYQTARKINMPRGKRILLYHKCLMEWKDIQKQVNRMEIVTNRLYRMGLGDKLGFTEFEDDFLR